MQMLRAGVKLAAVMPALAKTKINEALNEKEVEFDLDNLKPEDLQELIDAMADMTVDVNEGKEKVRVYCE
jgi:Asp-tRNA(Asn)/Glu-tRNA(Gln) amidotransferase B subunit